MSEPATPAVTARRLGVLMGGYLLVVIAAITLAPFAVDPGRVLQVHMVVREGWLSDALLNVALFMPVGVTLQRAFGWPVAGVAVGCALLSGMIEAAQLMIPPRFATVSDVAANVAGGALGAVFSRAVSRRVGSGEQLLRRMLLDLPLTGITYLLLPLVWLVGLTAGHHADVSATLLLAAGALVIGAVGAGAQGGHRGVPLAALGWSAVALVPMMRTQAGVLPALLVGAPLATIVARAGWIRMIRRDRRVEPQVVRLVVPLVCIVILVDHAGREALTMAGTERSRVAILDLIEFLTGFVLLGYLLAEWRGRRDEGELAAAVVPLGVAAMAAVALATLGGGSVTVLLVGATCGAGIGVLLYRRYRDHVIATARSAS